jgi:predicted  nucleic acid-binding Zn-ribbon protein
LISKLTVGEFISLSKRVFAQLDKELDTEDAIILPVTFNATDLGQNNILTVLDAYISHLQAKQFPQCENPLLWLAQYELQNGFYGKSKYKVHSIHALNLKKASDEISIQSQNLKQLQQQHKKLVEELNNQKKMLSDFQSQKEGELQQITNNLNTANTNTNQIQTLLNSSTQANSQVNSIAEQVQKDKTRIDTTSDDINKVYEKHKGEFADLLGKMTTKEKDFTDLYSDFEGKVKFVESKHSYFESRNTYLDNLIGREVGASLFETFKQRKTELLKPLFWWRIAVGIVAVVVVVAIFAVFTNFFGIIGEVNNTLTWEGIFVNTLKTLPFFFLLYYTISQYNKERNFQEEYAFKSAVALTVKAYSDVLTNTDNKDALIMKAVYNVYRSPIQNNSKPTKEVNSATDMLKDVVSKGTEVF